MDIVTAKEMLLRFGERELIQLTDTQEPFTRMINTDVLQQALDIANGEVVAGLQGRFAIPVYPEIPPMLVGITTDIARYYLAVGSARETERDVKRYEVASLKLTKIQKGELNIGLTPLGATPAAASSNDVIIVARPNDFAKGGW